MMPLNIQKMDLNKNYNKQILPVAIHANTTRSKLPKEEINFEKKTLKSRWKILGKIVQEFKVKRTGKKPNEGKYLT